MNDDTIGAALSGVKGEEQKSEPIILKIGGQDMTFESKEDLEQYLNNIHNIVQTAAKEAVSSVQQQQQQQFQQPGARYTAEDVAKDPTAARAQAEKIDLEKYAAMLKEDPVKAHAYVNRMIFGGVDPVAVVRELVGRQIALENYLTVQNFLSSHPDYVSTPENDRVLLEVINAHKLPFSPQSLELAYTYAKDRGMLKDTTPQAGGFSSQPVTGSATAASKQTNPQTPPPIGRSSGGAASEVPYLDEVEQLDPDQILELVRRLERGG